MKKVYTKPLLRMKPVCYDVAFCLSDLPDVGGTTSDYVEDNENLNG